MNEHMYDMLCVHASIMYIHMFRLELHRRGTGITPPWDVDLAVASEDDMSTAEKGEEKLTMLSVKLTVKSRHPE